MKKIAENPYYRISIDISMNRLYLHLFDFWDSCALVPSYLADLEKATASLTCRFTILTDTRDFRTPHHSVFEIHTQAQKLLLEKGLIATAELVGSDAITQLALNDFSQTSGMPKAYFDNQEQAEVWLNEQVKQSLVL